MNKSRSVAQIVEEQARRWELSKFESRKEAEPLVLTLSREPGSGGNRIAEKLAEALGFDLFDQEIVQEMSKNANISSRLVETLDERGLNTLEEWISHVITEKHLWPDEFLKHLMKIVGTIGKHGNAIIVGRGANFVIYPKNRFRIRIVAPLKTRVFNYSKRLGISEAEAKSHILRIEAERRAFIRKYFYADISDPHNYDMLLNTENIDVDTAISVIRNAIGR